MDKLGQLLKECMDNISVDSEVKKNILATNVQMKSQKMYRKKIVAGRFYKKLASIAACLIMIVAVTSVGTYALSGKSIFEVFFKESEPKYAKELLDYNGQTYEIDDYTITLEQTLYDSKTDIGYCVFAITKEGGKAEAKINKFNQTPGAFFGENGRFKIENFGSQSSEFEYVGDTLYHYLSFRTDDTFNKTIRLIDEFSEEDETKIEYYEFNLADSNKYKEFKVNDKRSVYISPIGIAIRSVGSCGDINIVLHYRNGKENKVVDTKNNIGTGLSREHSTDFDKYLYQFVFKKMVDIQEIDYITLNGEKVLAKK